MIVKGSFCLFVALFFFISSVMGMNGAGTPVEKSPLRSPDSTSEERQDLSSAENRRRSLSASEEEESNEESSFKQRGSAMEAAGQDISGAPSMKLFETPPLKKPVLEVQTEPLPMRPKESNFITGRSGLSNKQEMLLDLDKAQRLFWLTSGLTEFFSQSKSELNQKKVKQAIDKDVTDVQKIQAVREAFITLLEQCYGQEVVEELFADGEKENFLREQTPLSLENANGLIALADDRMAIGKSYFSKSQELAKPLQEAFYNGIANQADVEQAQKNYNDLNGSPGQHLLATAWYSARIVAWIVSNGCVIALGVTLHYGLPVIFGISSFAVGYCVNPANISRFVGCFFVPDNYTNMCNSWKKFGEARVALRTLKEQQQSLKSKIEAVAKMLPDIEKKKREIDIMISPALKDELDQSEKMKFWNELQQRIETFNKTKSFLMMSREGLTVSQQDGESFLNGR